MKIFKPQISDIPQILKLWQEQYEYHRNLDQIYYVSNSKELDNSGEAKLLALQIKMLKNHLGPSFSRSLGAL